MALPPTGSTITMTEINTYFGAGAVFSLGGLGTYLGISVGTVLPMSATFGGQGT
jgi:hypothetical protein